MTATAPDSAQAKSLLDGVPADGLAGIPRATFPAGTVLAEEDDFPGKMYVLLTGAAEVAVTNRDGERHVINTIHPGQPVGEMSLLTGQPASATVTTTEETELLLLRAEDLSTLGTEHPVVYRNLMAILASRLAGANRLALGESTARIVALDDRGAPDQLSHALACSVAWHTRRRTLLLEVDESAAPHDVPAKPSSLDVIRAHPNAVDELLAHAGRLYETILIRGRGIAASGADRVLPIGPPGSARGAELAVEAWADAAGPLPPRDGCVLVPALDARDQNALQRSVLPTGTGAGDALGWVARELTGLRVGVALGAGSSRGYAHLGALRALERHGIPVDLLAGTSIGAIVSALYSHLGSVDAAAEMLDELGDHVFRPTFSRRSLMSTRSLRRFVATNIGDGLIEEQPIPIAIVTADLVTGEEVVLRRGSVSEALFAAMAVPGIYPPVRLGSRVLVDGGVLDPVPTGIAARMGAGIVIGVKLSGGPGTIQLDEIASEGDAHIPSVVGTILRAIELVQTHVSRDLEQTSTVVVTPEIGAGTLRNFKSGRRFIEAGDAAIEQALPRLQAAVPWLGP
jgi:NTE family protein